LTSLEDKLFYYTTISYTHACTRITTAYTLVTIATGIFLRQERWLPWALTVGRRLRRGLSGLTLLVLLRFFACVLVDFDVAEAAAAAAALLELWSSSSSSS